MERDYEEIFQKVLDYEQTLHEKNRKRIKIGLKCIWIVPLFFLALLFLTGCNTFFKRFHAKLERQERIDPLKHLRQRLDGEGSSASRYLNDHDHDGQCFPHN